MPDFLLYSVSAFLFSSSELGFSDDLFKYVIGALR